MLTKLNTGNTSQEVEIMAKIASIRIFAVIMLTDVNPDGGIDPPGH